VPIKETSDYRLWPRDFILDEQLNDPNDVAERLRRSVHAISIDEGIRKLFKEQPATFLKVGTSRKYTEYETESASLAVMLHAYLKMQDPPFLQHYRPYGGQTRHRVAVTRIAEFNYILIKEKSCPAIKEP
jgi:hypothetical protein